MKRTLDRIEEAFAKTAMLEIKILSFQTSRLNFALSRIRGTINGNCSTELDLKWEKTIQGIFENEHK